MGSCSSFKGKMVTAEFIICIDYQEASQCFSTTGGQQEIMHNLCQLQLQRARRLGQCLSVQEHNDLFKVLLLPVKQSHSRWKSSSRQTYPAPPRQVEKCMYWELHWSYEHTFPCAFRALFQQVEYWQALGIPGRSGFRQSKQFLGQVASASGRLASLSCQRTCC